MTTHGSVRRLLSMDCKSRLRGVLAMNNMLHRDSVKEHVELTICREKHACWMAAPLPIN
jgi:hypothetical protein